LTGGGRFILSVLKPVTTAAAVEGQDPQKASVTPQYLPGEKVLETNDMIQHLPASVQEVLKKHPKVFEALAPGIDDKIHITDEVIPTQPHVPPFRPMYRLTPVERAEMEKQIAIFLANGWIRPSTSPYGAPILFAQKADGTLRMCVDYREVNKITIKNRYPLPNIQDLLDMLYGARYFTSLDLLSGYHQIALRDSDIPKTAFRTPVGHFEVLVLWEGLCNAPSIFQATMYNILKPFIGKFVALYIDDVLIFSKTEAEHAKHLDLVLGQLARHNLKAKLSKCKFAQKECKFLGHILSGEGIRVDPKKAQVVQDWPEPKTTKDLQRFLGLSNYFRRFIPNYSLIAADMTRLQARQEQWTPDTWGLPQKRAFVAIKKALAETTMLWHPDLSKPFELQVDASKLGVGAVLLQDVSVETEYRKQMRPIAFFSKQFTEVEKKLLPADQEFYGLIFAMEHFREYLEGVKFVVKTDNSPLTALLNNPKLNRRKANAVDKLSRYDFTIEHISGVTNNVADCLSRNPCWTEPTDVSIISVVTRSNRGLTSGDLPTSETARKLSTYHKQVQHMQQAMQPQHAPTVVELPIAPNDEYFQDFLHPLLGRIITGYVLDKWFADPVNTKGLTKTATGLWLKQEGKVGLSHYKNPFFNHRIVIPDAHDLRKLIMHFYHDLPGAGHRSAVATIEKVGRDFWWPGWSADIERYCRNCDTCQKVKYRTQVPYGLLKPLEIPERKWGSISMDFLTNLPVTKTKKDTILVVVDRLTKMSHLIPMQLTSSAVVVAKLLHDNVFKLHGLPDSVVSDRDPRLVSNFMQEVWKLWGVQQCLSTAYRPQTDGQTERLNRTLQEYLRAYVTPQGKEWEEALSCAEFALNDTYHTAIGCTPFFLNYGCHPRSPWSIRLTGQSVPAAHKFVSDMQFNVQMAKKLLRKAQDRMKVQYDRHHKHHTFALGEQVLLSSENLKLLGCTKFWPRFVGPFTIKAVIDQHNYQLQLPTGWGIHDVFHISLLKPYYSDGSYQPPPIPEVLAEDAFQITALLDHRVVKKGRHTLLQFLCHYQNAPPESRTWENEKDIQSSCPELLKVYKQRFHLLPFKRDDSDPREEGEL